MELYLLRHGIAAELGDNGVTRDEDRPLTDLGWDRMRREATGLVKLGLEIDLILASPLIRARQTAQAVAETLDLEDKMIIMPSLAPGQGFPRGVNEQAPIFVEAGARQFERALLVGHEPDISMLASVLLIGGYDLNVRFKKGAVCAIECPRLAPRLGSLLWFLSPRQLRQLASAKK